MRVLAVFFSLCLALGAVRAVNTKHRQASTQHAFADDMSLVDQRNRYDLYAETEKHVAESVVIATLKVLHLMEVKEATKERLKESIKYLLLLLSIKDSIDGVEDDGMIGKVEHLIPKAEDEVTDAPEEKHLKGILLLLALQSHVDGEYAANPEEDIINQLTNDMPEYPPGTDFEAKTLALLKIALLKFHLDAEDMIYKMKTYAPTSAPTYLKTNAPTAEGETYTPTSAPTYITTNAPTAEGETYTPTSAPTYNTTNAPTAEGETYAPTSAPIYNATNAPTAEGETYAPTSAPIYNATNAPTAESETLAPTTMNMSEPVNTSMPDSVGVNLSVSATAVSELDAAALLDNDNTASPLSPLNLFNIGVAFVALFFTL